MIYLLKGQYSFNKNVRFKTSMLGSDLCDYSDTYIVVKGTITVAGTNSASKGNKKLTFKNIAPFRSCISKIVNTFVDNVEDLDIVMPMYNLLEYSGNYSMTSGSLWNYYRVEVNYSQGENENKFRINNNKTTATKPFEYKTKIIGSTQNNNILDAEVVVPLKHFSNFWKCLDLPLINCEIELDLRWTKNCIICEIPRPSIVIGNPSVWEMATEATAAIFQMNNAKLYAPVVTLSINYNIKFVENIKQGFKTISWNKNRSEITQTKNNLDYLIDPIFRNIVCTFIQKW